MEHPRPSRCRVIRLRAELRLRPGPTFVGGGSLADTEAFEAEVVELEAVGLAERDAAGDDVAELATVARQRLAMIGSIAHRVLTARGARDPARYARTSLVVGRESARGDGRQSRDCTHREERHARARELPATPAMLGSRPTIVLGFLMITEAGCAPPETAEVDAASAAVTAENPDVQSPEEVAAADEAVLRDFGRLTDPDEIGEVERATRPPGYAHLDRSRLVPQGLLDTAITYFDRNKSSFRNKNYITVVDLGARSDKFRLFVVNVTDGSVERYHTTHGRGDGPKEDADGFAPGFGNVPSSGKSSLGFVRTAEVYSGTFNRAIRLDGLSTTNSKMRSRFIVFHGWDDTREANVIQAQTHGCITMDWAYKDRVLDRIKEGSLLYAGRSGS